MTETARPVVHLVPHTHWDREWYEPFQTFRLRLVDLVDQLLERMTADSRLRFTLDGQCATVDDYLEVRPENEPLIRRLVAEGRLAIGPWQILMDEFLVSGETMVRNLELGWARATELGGAMRVGYLPDMFGHVAQMPQLLRRAGIERAVVWRGVPASIDRNVFTWSAPDGSEVEAEYLVNGYGNGAYLFDVPDRLRAKLDEHIATYEPYYGRHSVLAMYGTDHMVPTPRLADLVDEVNRDGSGPEVRLQTLAEYALRADREARSDGRAKPSWTGELRSGARANVLMGVASARVDIKVAAGRAERLLERYAEPLTALHAGTWPARPLELAWRRVVDNSAHDSICGCSHDQVVAQVLTRFAEAEQLGRGVLQRTLSVIGHRVAAGSWAVVNPSPHEREEVVEIDVAVPPEWAAVELQVGGRRLATQEAGRADPLIADLRLHGSEVASFLERRRHGRELFQRQLNAVTIDEEADEVPTIRLFADDLADPPELDVEALLAPVVAATRRRADEPWRLIVRAAERRRLFVRVPAPALGWSAVDVVEAGMTEDDVPDAVRLTERGLDNGLVAVEVDPDGTFRLTGGGSSLAGVGRIVEGGDFGDSYNYGPPSNDVVVEQPVSVRVGQPTGGPLRAEILVERTFPWPVGVLAAGDGRTPEAVPTDVTMRLELRAGEPWVRVAVAFENRSRDHRVRFHVPLPHAAGGSHAEGQFAVVARGLDLEGGHGEVPLPTFPARGFVHTAGVSALLEHLTEYEVVDGRELAITLLRSFGLISRNANPYREDPAGPQLPVPAAQMPGHWWTSFALAPHADDWAAAGVLDQAERYAHPPLVVRGTGPVTQRPAEGLSVAGDGVVMTALRRRDDWLEIRLVAEHDRATTATIRGPFDAARAADLLGRPGGELEVRDGTLVVELGAWEIRTLQLRSSSTITPS